MTFLQNKYTSAYYKIINGAQNSERAEEYVEKHHIVPKSLGGSNAKSNIVKLTGREHFVCHLLLTKMVQGADRKKMAWALHRMTFSKTGNRVLTSREFELGRKRFSIAVSGFKHTEEAKKKIGDAHRGKVVSAETRQKLSEHFTGYTFSEERNAKIAVAHTGKKRAPFTEEHRANISKVNTGRVYTEERNAKISSALKGKPKSPEHRAKIAAAVKLARMRTQ